MNKRIIGVILLLMLTMCVSLSVGYAESDPNGYDQSLLFYLPFEGTMDDATGQTAVEVHGDVSFAEDGCCGSQCAYFDGDGDYLDLGIGFNFHDSFTASVWVKSESETRSDAALLAKYETNGYGPYDLYLSKNRPAIWISNGKGRYTKDIAGSAIDDQWHMVTWTYQKSDRKYTTYVDGVEDRMTVLDHDLTANDDHVTIGRQAFMFAPHDHLEYRGYMDEFRIYDISLTSEEVLNLYLFSLTKAVD